MTLLGEAIASAGRVTVFVWDDDRRYVAVNDAACTLVGLPRAELLGMAVGALSTADGNVEEVQRHDTIHGASTFTRRDGTEVALEWVTFRTRIAGLPYMASVCWPQT